MMTSAERLSPRIISTVGAGATTGISGVTGPVTFLPPLPFPVCFCAAGALTMPRSMAGLTPGVSGGPLLDVAGRLVGVIAGYEAVTPDNPYQFLGRAVPIDLLRAAYASTP